MLSIVPHRSKNALDCSSSFQKCPHLFLIVPKMPSFVPHRSKNALNCRGHEITICGKRTSKLIHQSLHRKLLKTKGHDPLYLLKRQLREKCCLQMIYFAIVLLRVNWPKNERQFHVIDKRPSVVALLDSRLMVKRP
ncbi:hypothetical protein AVEN_2320-1 [Araneus ventricosus]|uniref:Uncharacterized protein n=1 Tax=Araneus ventricosus TaxID=182803 RepID=A0A4Y2S9L2_ARAVE|nr:hypothetical protein AVEN_2320-1 [Araneus ventricosus]